MSFSDITGYRNRRGEHCSSAKRRVRRLRRTDKAENNKESNTQSFLVRSPPTSSVGRAYKSRATILEIKETHLQWVRFFYLCNRCHLKKVNKIKSFEVLEAVSHASKIDATMLNPLLNTL